MRAACIVSLIVLVFAACGRHEVSREHWMRSTPDERELIVRSFLGGEQAADSKGGSGEKYSRSPAFYRSEIDARYAAGDQRPVSELWQELSDGALQATSK